MIKRTTRPTSNFYCLNNAIVSDKDLSWAARGLLVFLLTKPDNWRISLAHLISETKSAIGKKSGRDNVYSLLNELICAGYLSRIELRSESGKIEEIDYIISEIKAKEVLHETTEAPVKKTGAKNNIIKMQHVIHEKPLTDNPDTAKPDTVKRTLTKNKDKQGIKEKLLPTELAASGISESSSSFDPNCLNIESGIISKTEAEGIKQYLATSIQELDKAQMIADEVIGKVRSSKALGHDKPIKTVVGYTKALVMNLAKGTFLESHAIAERQRREKLRTAEINRNAYAHSSIPSLTSVQMLRAKTRVQDDLNIATRSQSEIFSMLGMRQKPNALANC